MKHNWFLHGMAVPWRKEGRLQENGTLATFRENAFANLDSDDIWLYFGFDTLDELGQGSNAILLGRNNKNMFLTNLPTGLHFRASIDPSIIRNHNVLSFIQQGFVEGTTVGVTTPPQHIVKDGKEPAMLFTQGNILQRIIITPEKLFPDTFINLNTKAAKDTAFAHFL